MVLGVQVGVSWRPEYRGLLLYSDFWESGSIDRQFLADNAMHRSTMVVVCPVPYNRIVIYYSGSCPGGE